MKAKGRLPDFFFGLRKFIDRMEAEAAADHNADIADAAAEVADRVADAVVTVPEISRFERPLQPAE